MRCRGIRRRIVRWCYKNKEKDRMLKEFQDQLDRLSEKLACPGRRGR